MHNLYFTVGPSKIFPSVSKYIAEAFEHEIPSISHRGEKFQNIVHDTISRLKRLLSIPDTYRVFFLTSGTEGMERIVQNCVQTQSFHIVTGAFGTKFYNTALGYGKKAIEHRCVESSELVPTIPKGVELIAVTHNDTSTGFQFPTESLTLLKKQNPEVLVAVDVVSSIPHVVLDYSTADCVFFSIQKGFGLPAGLGVLVVSPQALEHGAAVAASGTSVGFHHSFAELIKYGDKNQTHETPNVLGVYLFEKILEEMETVGIETIRRGVDARAERLYDFFQEHADHFTLIQREKNLQSKTIVVAEVRGGSKPLIEALKKEGIVIGAGYGADKEKNIRIANFPAHTDSDLERLMAGLESALS